MSDTTRTLDYLWTRPGIGAATVTLVHNLVPDPEYGHVPHLYALIPGETDTPQLVYQGWWTASDDELTAALNGTRHAVTAWGWYDHDHQRGPMTDLEAVNHLLRRVTDAHGGHIRPTAATARALAAAAEVPAGQAVHHG